MQCVCAPTGPWTQVCAMAAVRPTSALHGHRCVTMVADMLSLITLLPGEGPRQQMC
jgi:hypothetical protein